MKRFRAAGGGTRAGALAVAAGLLWLCGCASPLRAAEKAPPVPECLRDLAKEEPEGRWSLPSYVNGLRILDDGTAVLATWQDPEKRRGREKGKKRVWIPGEAARELHPDPIGPPILIDRDGNAWFRPVGESPYYVVGADKVAVCKFPSTVHGTPWQDSRGRVWIQDYTGVHLCGPDGTVQSFELFETGLPVKRRYGTFGMCENADGSILFYPNQCEDMSPKDKKRPGEASLEKANLWMLYLPKGDPKSAIKVPLGTERIYQAAPLPGGAWMIHKWAAAGRMQGAEVWFPPDPAHERSKLGALLEELGSEDFGVREKALFALRIRTASILPTLQEREAAEREPRTRAALSLLLRYAAAAPLAPRRYVGPFDGWYFLDACPYRGEGEGLRFLLVVSPTRDPKVALAPEEPEERGIHPVSLGCFDASGKFSMAWKDFPGNAMASGRFRPGPQIHGVPGGSFFFCPLVTFRPHPTIQGTRQQSNETYRLVDGVATPWPIQAPGDRHASRAPSVAQVDRDGRLYYYDPSRGAFFIIPDVRGDPPRWKEP